MSFQKKMQQKMNHRLKGQYEKPHQVYNSKDIKKRAVTSNNKLSEYSEPLYDFFDNHQYSSNLDIEGELNCQEIICDRLTLRGGTGFTSILNNVTFETPLKNVIIKKGNLKSCYLNNSIILGGSLGSSQSINFINSQQLNIQNQYATQSYLQIGGEGRESTISTGYSSLNSSTARDVDLNLESNHDINLKSQNINFKSGNNTVASINEEGILYHQTNIIKDDDEIALETYQSGSIVILQTENKIINLPEPKNGVHYKIIVKNSDSWNLRCSNENDKNKFIGNIFNFNTQLEVIELPEVSEIQFSKCKTGDKLEIISDGIQWIISGWFNSTISFN